MEPKQLNQKNQSQPTQKLIRYAGTAMFAVGVILVIVCGFIVFAGIAAGIRGDNWGMDTIVKSAMYVLIGSALMRQSVKLQAQSDTKKAAGTTKMIAIVLSVLTVVAAIFASWIGVVLFLILAIYLFIASTKLAKA